MIAGSRRWLLAALAAAFAVSWFSPHYNRYYLGVAMDVGIAVIMAVSLNLINGHTGQFSLGHAGFMAVGGFTAAKLTMLTSNAFFPLSLLVGGLMAACVGLIVGVPSLRLKGDYLAIVTLGFGEIIRVVFQNSQAFGAATGLTGIPKLTTLFWTWGAAAVTVYVVTSLVNSTYGCGFICVHDDEVAAAAIGVSPTRYKVTAFVVGAFFAGVAGGLYAHHKQVMQPDGFGFIRSIDFVVMVILGGMGRTAGVIAAAIVLTLLPEFLRVREFASYRMIIYSLLIIGLMMARPQGLFTFGKKSASSV
ncbi:MAG: branched-chain amino acid ABC transporter permease [Verrucomicrobiota bacterium]|jgi:branched-chain amino acid transport system permease protein